MLKLEVGKSYEDTEGQVTKIVHQYANKLGQFLGIRHAGERGFESSECYSQTGVHQEYQNYNLVREAKPPRYRWFNLYDSMPGCTYHMSKELAQVINGRIATYKVELNTGTVTREDT